MATRAARGFGPVQRRRPAPLERVGDRWALLIVRDLLVGARRYSDLKAALPRIPTNILSDRLKELQEAGVVRRVPTVRGGYELTELGRALEPVIVALERWGWSTLGEPAEGEVVTRDALAVVASRRVPSGCRGRLPADRVRAARGRRLAVGRSSWRRALDVVPIGPGALPQPRRGPAPEAASEAVRRARGRPGGVPRPRSPALLDPAAVRLVAGEADAVVRFARTFRIDPVGPAPDATTESGAAAASVA